MDAPPTEAGSPALPAGRNSPVRRAIRSSLTPALAGPLLITAVVLVVMHGFWLGQRLSTQQVDVLSFWLSRWSAIGEAVRHLRVPTWLPNEFAGVPFASDPQSGWMYLPVMALFGVFAPWRALTYFITLQPLFAGLGFYLFLRKEQVSRPAATAGGLTMAMGIAGSVVALSMPFAGSLAWTALTLAGAAGLLHARRPASMAGWLAWTGLAWSQIAAAHMTDGLLTGTLTVAAYVVARLVVSVRRHERSLPGAAAIVGALVVALPLLSAAVLWPRLQLLPRTSIGQGYTTLAALTQQLSGKPGAAPIALVGVGPWWGTAFARGPSGYVGALAILLMVPALASRRWRWPAAAFALLGLLGWVANQNVLIGSEHVRHLALHTGLGTLWLRSPYRFRYLLLPAFAAMAGFGLQAWLDLPLAAGRRMLARRAWWFGPPLVVFLVAPLVAGASVSSYVPFLAGGTVAVVLLLLATAGRAWVAPLIAAALAVELAATALVSQGGPPPPPPGDVLTSTATSGVGKSFPSMHDPWISSTAYLTPGPIGRALIAARGDGGRYLPFSPAIATQGSRGFLFHQTPASWPAYANGRAVLFGLNEVEGYSPVQLMRYWSYVRALDTRRAIFYNSSTFQFDPPQVLDLFGIEWIVQPAALAPPADSTLTAREGGWVLYRYDAWQPRASMVYRWLVAPHDVQRVLAPGFNPAYTGAVDYSPSVNGTPLISLIPGDRLQADLPKSPHATVRYQDLSPEHVRIRVTTSAPGLLVVRNPYDEYWHAQLDGRPAILQPADYVMQGVAVPAGTHTIDLTYRDLPIGQGAAASAISWVVLACAWLWLWRRGRRAPKEPPPSAEQVPEPADATLG